MKRLIGTKWGALTPELQNELLSKAQAVDSRTCERPKEDGRCIIDLTNYYSVAGELVDDEIIIEDDAEIYSPSGYESEEEEEGWETY